MTAHGTEELLRLLPEPARSKFKSEVVDFYDELAAGKTEEEWEETGCWPWELHFGEDSGRWATVWEVEGVWVVHLNESPGGYYVDEYRFRDGMWWGVEGQVRNASTTYYERYPNG